MTMSKEDRLQYMRRRFRVLDKENEPDVFAKSDAVIPVSKNDIDDELMYLDSLRNIHQDVDEQLTSDAKPL